MQQLIQQFSNWITLLQQRFDRLPLHDRRMVMGAAAFVFLTIFYLMLTNSRDYQQAAIAYYKAMTENMRWIELNMGQIKAVAGGGEKSTGSGSDASLISVASTSAKPFGISFKRFQPEGDTGLRLWIEAAEFDQLLRWVGAMGKQGVVFGQLDINRVEKSPGLIDARVLIVREQQ